MGLNQRGKGQPCSLPPKGTGAQVSLQFLEGMVVLGARRNRDRVSDVLWGGMSGGHLRSKEIDMPSAYDCFQPIPRMSILFGNSTQPPEKKDGKPEVVVVDFGKTL
jgi:hypothetical protein